MEETRKSSELPAERRILPDEPVTLQTAGQLRPTRRTGLLGGSAGGQAAVGFIMSVSTHFQHVGL